MYFDDGEVRHEMAPVSAWCIVPMWLALAPLLVMGLWWPHLLWEHFQTIAHTLRPAMPAEAAR